MLIVMILFLPVVFHFIPKGSVTPQNGKLGSQSKKKIFLLPSQTIVIYFIITLLCVKNDSRRLTRYDKIQN